MRDITAGKSRNERDSYKFSRLIKRLGTTHFKEIVDRAYTKKEVVNMFGFRPSRSSYSFVSSMIEKLDINISHFKECWNQIPIKEIFIKHEDGKRRDWRQRKRALIKVGRLHECEWCGNKGLWRGKQMILEIDHVNGDPSDDRKENLRFLCPNCHSQTRNFRVPFAKRKHEKGDSR